ncbi:hypothetical protein BLNAU_12364 [Blattamonas nauphoetae]|uniref:Uncharacterized protein n=1 Tax=Blattamonas nauphoetae TaxID=2049346 RepID=A0ABQ9XMJ2_9EUKA|nr:hypothetical protein BLNAU_12364 [Blattamonas nauphoetae]
MRVLVRINGTPPISIHPAHSLPPHPNIDECFQADRTKAEETEAHPLTTLDVARAGRCLSDSPPMFASIAFLLRFL